ncbi:hypothetical protein GCM10009801_32130 [Streptomyces albiaxialis]|uniref:Thiolase C-terminal domain-containing protein n=1 Tax=Streptomyces albiaxialis TaxID=329523 RepID=A0ABN2VXZ9_9ACTN
MSTKSAKSAGGLLSPRVSRRVAVIGGSRIPFARADGPYARCSNQEMLTAALDGLVERFGLQGPGAVGEFAAGAVLKHSRERGSGGRPPEGRSNLAREAVLGSALATGHPFAATGARVVATLAKLLAEREGMPPGARGLISVCAAGGQGVTAVLERA